MSLSEIIEVLEQLGGRQISMSAVSRAIKNRLPSGQQYSRKNSQKWQGSKRSKKTEMFQRSGNKDSRHGKSHLWTQRERNMMCESREKTRNSKY